jgi:hypothetical protein
MMEPVGISNQDLSFKQLGYKLGELMTITANLVFSYP